MALLCDTDILEYIIVYWRPWDTTSLVCHFSRSCSSESESSTCGIQQSETCSLLRSILSAVESWLGHGAWALTRSMVHVFQVLSLLVAGFLIRCLRLRNMNSTIS